MICVCFCALRRVKVNHQCAASPQNDSTLAPLRCWRSRLGDSKNSLIIAKAAARGDCGASSSNPLPNRIDDGDFATIISSCPGDISSIGFGDGASHSSNSTLPPESTDRVPHLPPSIAVLTFSLSLSYSSSSSIRDSPPSRVFVALARLGAVPVVPLLALGVFTAGVFAPSEFRDFPDFNNGLVLCLFTALVACDALFRRFSPVFAFDAFEFAFALDAIPSLPSVLAALLETKSRTHRAHPRSLYRHFEHPMRVGRARRASPSRARAPAHPPSGVALRVFEFSPAEGEWRTGPLRPRGAALRGHGARGAAEDGAAARRVDGRKARPRRRSLRHETRRRGSAHGVRARTSARNRGEQATERRAKGGFRLRVPRCEGRRRRRRSSTM